MLIDAGQPHSLRVARKVTALAYLRARNLGRASLVGDTPAVVSMTSYSSRLDTVAYALESIGAGTIRPQRLILWVSDDDFDLATYPMLQRAAARGLEVLHCKDHGPHKKSHPYCKKHAGDGLDLVTADDDILYPRRWLGTLLDAAKHHPDTLLGLRGHTIQLRDNGALAPYASWPTAPVDRTSFASFPTGVAGILIPPRAQRELQRRGTDFLASCPRADDVWVHQTCVSIGIRSRIVSDDLNALAIPRTQSSALHHQNVGGGGNDQAIRGTYSGQDLKIFRKRKGLAH